MVKLTDEQREELRNTPPATPRGNRIPSSIDNQEVEQAPELDYSSISRVSEVANVDDIGMMSYKFRETEGKDLVLLSVEFREGRYKSKDNTSAWIRCYYQQDKTRTVIKVVGSGYAVIEQLKLVKEQDNFPCLGKFVQNPDKENRWELI